MNTNDFYKELMSEYSFDHEKIKKAAMGKAPAKKAFRISAKVTAAVSTAAVIAVVSVGTALLLPQGNPVSVSPTTSMTPSERFQMAVEAYEKSDENTEECFLYVTFKNSETPSDMQSILSRTNNTGKIKVISVYLTDNSVVTGSSNIQELFDYNEENITAVQIRCPGNYFKKLTVSPEVYLVETEESFKESVFSVIDTGESYEDYPGYSDSPEAPDTSESTPVIGDTTPPEE